MRILYFTDTHIKGTNPKNRKDDFLESLQEKFREIVSIVRENNVDFVIHGGDLFDRPDISTSVVSRFTTILKNIEKPIFIVSGNHDIFGHNPATIDRTMLGLLKSMDFIKVISRDKPIVIEKNGIRVSLTSLPYTYDIDSTPEGYILKEVPENMDYSIHVVHGMLLDRPFVKGIPYTLIDDILETAADITLSGHYHAGFKTIEKNGKYFVNPGSLVRVTNSLKEIERIPQVAIIDLDSDIKVEMLQLTSAKPGIEVLDRTEMENCMFRSERIVQFKQSIDSAMSFEKMDLNDILLEVTLSEGVSDEVKEEALRRIANSQMKGY
ncbi:metallophosphoesterase family protein [Gudongella sp. SC589]|uniref:metallophosphoesterase family protein n=1 Tax=Gudongella sp. SC589 TaxID=3385990 RepID=UPI003904B81D